MVAAETFLGSQTPRIVCLPGSPAASRAGEVLELGRSCGLVADPWQEMVVGSMFGFRADGLFSAMRVGLNVPRQNGKGTVLELRELGGIFVLGERLITHTSQMQDTSLEAMNRLVEALEEGGLQSELKDRGGVMTGNGRESLNFKSGQRIRFRTRSKTSARGWSGQCTIFDEAMFISFAGHTAAFPIISAQPNPQVVYAGSAADKEQHDHAHVWASLREEGIAASERAATAEDRLAYFEWSAPFDHPSDVPADLDLGLVRVANPAFGIRITEPYVREEHKALNVDGRGFPVERLGVGDYPRMDGSDESVVDVEAWAALEDASSEVLDPVHVRFDVSPARKSAVAVAGVRDDGFFHVEVVEFKTGTAWLPAFLAAFVEKHQPESVGCDGRGPVDSIVRAVEDELGMQIVRSSAKEFEAACGQFVDAVADATVRHLGQQSLNAAVKGAAARPMVDAWAWSRKNAKTDSAPLVAVTLALSSAMAAGAAGDWQVY